MSPPAYRLLLAAHIIVSGAWLGIAFAKVVLGAATASTGTHGLSNAL
jgi:hypothetical protein